MIGQTLSRYRITAALGAGGMGEVYRARDTTLDREAKLLASLNHTNIAHVYGFESATLDDASSVHFLAMEVVEGEDLAERLKRGAIPLDEALAIARQIAEALEEAHEHGIIHRDLKPANIKLTPDGKVKVLDFGLAKAYAGEGATQPGDDLSQSPTLARTGTQAGVILGTAAYMSPEQARGKSVDKRADIWAFGVVLFEMLTGQRLFRGETTSDTLAAVLKTDPDWSLLPAETPPRIREMLGRCLTRDPRERLHDIADARIEIAGARSSAGQGLTQATRPAWRAPLLAATLGLAAGAALVWRVGPGGARTTAMKPRLSPRFSVALLSDARF